ncbi:MAG TPA: hypothetical protein VEG24_07895 [Gaiellaceae bacterium]|nr:hypothetical protein [Gaiellaceae bacterium]
METSLRSARRPPRPARIVSPPPRPAPGGGADGNERLTAGAAVVLFVLLAVEGVTIVFLRPLFSVHVFVGMLLIPPVALKVVSTGWRFVRYYTGRQEYVRKGPPLLPLRLLAPVVLLSTVALFASGVALLVVGPGGGIVLGLHKASFAVWLVATGIHVLAYLTRVPKLAAADWRRPRRPQLGGSGARRGLLAGSIVAGTILAVTTLQYAQPWLHWIAVFRGHDH